MPRTYLAALLAGALLAVPTMTVPALADPGPNPLPIENPFDYPTQVVADPAAAPIAVPGAVPTPVVAPIVAADLTGDPAGDPTGNPAGNRRLELPEVLSDEDVDLYRKIFALQEKARWGPADRAMKKIGDPILLGHLLAQRYLHPCCYRSKYRELKRWLDRYADHPQATRIYKLARKRRPQRAAYPRRPIIAGGVPALVSVDENPALPKPRLSKKNRKNARYLRSVFSRHLRRGRLKSAANILARKDAERLFGRVGYDEARSRLAFVYFRKGLDKEALRLAGASAARSSTYLPFAHWTAGLAAWRLGKYDESAGHFETMAESKRISGWNKSAAAYWASRANLVGRRPERVNRWLEVAAQYPRTFYGMLATRSLGLESPFDWTLPEATDAQMARLVAAPPAGRALALLQIGRRAMAEREFAQVRHVGDDELTDALLALADAANLPRLSLRVGKRLAHSHGRTLDGALYPLPEWHPEGGFIVDRALVFAVIRQESQFNSRAKSRSGARGLMQLMPRTASFIARNRSLHRGKRDRLYNPALNIALGQKYLQYLLEHESIQGNLLLATVAYNAGPGNLAKWQRRIDHRDDPLLFIEIIPARETRVYVERVFTNLWIYRQRLGQQTPSLDAIAAGQWPVYKALDDAQGAIATNEPD